MALSSSHVTYQGRYRIVNYRAGAIAIVIHKTYLYVREIRTRVYIHII